MKGFTLIIAVLVLIVTVAVSFYFLDRVGSDKAPFLIVAVVCGSVCFIGALGLVAWQEFLEFKKLLSVQSKRIDDVTTQIQTLQTKVAKETVSIPAAELKYRASELLQLAEKMRAKKYLPPKEGDPPVLSTEEVPQVIQEFIIKNFPKS